MSALPYGSAFPVYGSATPYNPYPAIPSYSAVPSYSAAPIYDAGSAYQSYPYATSYPTYEPAASPAAQSKPQTVVVKTTLSEAESLAHFKNIVRAEEDSVTSAYQELERAQVKMNQDQSEEYGRMFHAETEEYVKYVHKLDSLKYELSEKVLEEANTLHCFPKSIVPTSGQPPAPAAPPAGGAAPAQKQHPVIELKELQRKVRDLRIILQSAVDNQ
jgi:hypothetical protein